MTSNATPPTEPPAAASALELPPVPVPGAPAAAPNSAAPSLAAPASATPPAPAMLSVQEYRDTVLALAPQRRIPVEILGLEAAIGRHLARDLPARLAVPPFDNSAMDGFAVRGADVESASADSPIILKIVGEVAAGSAQQVRLRAGQAARIMTGAPIPEGADAIVPVEHTVTGSFAGGGDTFEVAVTTAPKEHAHIRRAGGDVSPGDLVLRGGTRLTARHVSAGASMGFPMLEVVARPRVYVLSTGAELVPPGLPLAPGQIPESNSYLLTGLLRAAGVDVRRVGIVSDDVNALREALDEAALHCDLIVTTGGVSAGAHDVVKELLADAGSQFYSVAVQPGKPQGCGRWNDTPIVCLPGNPVSVFASFELFVRPFVRALLGLDPVPASRPAIAAVGWRCPPGRSQVIPVTVDDDGRVRPASSGGSGSHLVASLALAEAIAVVGPDVDEVAPGDTVTLMEIDA